MKPPKAEKLLSLERTSKERKFFSISVVSGVDFLADCRLGTGLAIAAFAPWVRQ